MSVLSKLYKSIYHQKAILPAFHYFLFHENILYTSEVIALLVTVYIIHRQIFGHFLHPLAAMSFPPETTEIIEITQNQFVIGVPLWL